MLLLGLLVNKQQDSQLIL